MSSDDPDVEWIIEDTDSDANFSSPETTFIAPTILVSNLDICRQVFPTFTFEQLDSDRFTVVVPSSILPRSLAVVNQFDRHPILVRVDVTLLNDSFRASAMIHDISHPLLGVSFCGRPLVVDAIRRFFSASFRPHSRYRCQVYVMEPIARPSDMSLARLVSEGHPVDAARRALVLTGGDISHAEDFLMTGATTFRPPEIGFTYDDCPLIYLIFEICEAFFNLTDHCCICGKDLGVQGVKASLCDSPVCLFGFRDIGVGSSVITELRRDPIAADLLISLASVSMAPFGTYFIEIACTKVTARPTEGQADLPVRLLANHPNFWNELPPIAVMITRGTDAALIQMIGTDNYEILRGILLSNKTHLIHLPDELKVKECAAQTDQFFAIISSPERELAFRTLKAKHRASYLWHGSPASSWMSILQNGLGLASQGVVYHSPYSTTSLGYSGKGSFPNKYRESQYKGAPILLGLVESVTGQGFKQGSEGPQEYTQSDFNGIVLRCLMIVKATFEWDAMHKPPKFVPTLHDCLQYLAKQGLHE
jgi:poly [ADP-ribose] polymerase 6/8